MLETGWEEKTESLLACYRSVYLRLQCTYEFYGVFCLNSYSDAVNQSRVLESSFVSSICVIPLLMVHNSGSQPRVFCHSKHIWQYLETFFHCHKLGRWEEGRKGSVVASGILWMEARDAASNPQWHQICYNAQDCPYNKELSNQISTAKVEKPCIRTITFAENQ